MTEWITRLIEQTGYLGVAFLMFIETVFPPIPSEVIMPLAGLEAQRGAMTLPGVIAAGTVGAMLGNFFWYLFARALGIERFKPFIIRYGRWLTINWRDVEKADKWFQSPRHLVRADRADAADGALARLGARWPAPHADQALPGRPRRSAPRLDRRCSPSPAGRWASNIKDIDQYLGPLSMGILVLLGLYYLYRVATWKPH